MKLSKLLILTFLAFSIALTACGRKKDPRPPEDFAPLPVRYLKVSAGVNSVVLSWMAPLENADGDELEDLANFEVKKREFIEENPHSYKTLAVVNLDPSQGENADFEYSVVDDEVEPGKVYDYTVLAINTDGEPTELPQRARVVFSGQTSAIEIRE